MNCSKCGTQMEMQTVAQTKHRNPLVILIYIVLLFIPVIGWIALFKILGGSKKQKAVTFAVCPNCGHRKKV